MNEKPGMFRTWGEAVEYFARFGVAGAVILVALVLAICR